MRAAGQLDSQAQAKRFADYLLTLGIETRVAADAGAWVLWVLDDDYLPKTRTLLERFRADPDASIYVRAAGDAAALRKKEREEADRAKRDFVDVRSRWLYGVRGRRALTWTLIGLSVAGAGIVGLGRGAEPILRWLTIASYEAEGGYVRWYGLTEIASGELWRLVTPIFLHFGPLHLLFNMFWLRDLGSLIEVRKGAWFLALLVIVTAVPSNLAQYFLAGPAFGGMSGVVYGLFGYVWLKGRYEPAAGMSLQSNTVGIMLAWLALGFTGLLGTANGAHLGGLVVGCALAYGAHVWRTLRR